MAVLLAEIFGPGADRAVLLDQRRHDVVDWFEIVGLARRIPGGEAEDVVPRFRLRLRRDGQQILVAVGGNEVDLELDLFLFCPFATQRFERSIGAGNPMIPKPDAEFPGSMGTAHEGSRQYGRRQRRSPQYGAPCDRHHSCLFRLFRCTAARPSLTRRLARGSDYHRSGRSARRRTGFVEIGHVAVIVTWSAFRVSSAARKDQRSCAVRNASNPAETPAIGCRIQQYGVDALNNKAVVERAFNCILISGARFSADALAHRTKPKVAYLQELKAPDE